jgi:hypothetical protein
MKRSTAPSVIVLAGANGAGKTTAAFPLLRDALGVTEFVNADLLAQDFVGFDPERAARFAAKAMLQRIDDLAQQCVNVAFETTARSVFRTTKFAVELLQLRQQLLALLPDLLVVSNEGRQRLANLHKVASGDLVREGHQGGGQLRVGKFRLDPLRGELGGGGCLAASER